MLFDTSKSIIQELSHSQLVAQNIRLFVKRDDLIDEEVSGNKWRKLKFNIEQFKVLKNDSILTFGGAFSNHLLATASACQKMNVPSVGVVRGEELTADSNPLLKRCSELGMHLHFVSREEYALRGMNEYFEELKSIFPNCYIIPEGGANYYGMIGCQEIIRELPSFDRVFVAQGTATTSAGLLLGLNENQKLDVVPAIKGFDAKKEMHLLYRKAGIDEETIEELLEQVVVHGESHFGGYAKSTPELKSFMDFCKATFDLPLDKVYTAKSFHGLWDAIMQNQLSHCTIVFLHTGGLGSHSE